jgi:hypothetical protein
MSLVTDDLFVSVGRAAESARSRSERIFQALSSGLRFSLRFRLFLVSYTSILGRIAEVDVYIIAKQLVSTPFFSVVFFDNSKSSSLTHLVFLCKTKVT